MPIFSASVKVMPCSGCAAYLPVHMYSDAATHKPRRTASIMGDLSRFTAAYSFIPCFFTKKLLAKVTPPLPACFCREVVPQSATQDTRQAGWKQGSVCSESRKPTSQQGCHWRAGCAGCVGRPAVLPAHPMGSALAPRHRNPLPHSAKPRRSNIMSQALLLAPETHDTGLQIEDFLK